MAAKGHVAADRMSSMLAKIDLGWSIEQAKTAGIVQSSAEREMWERLAVQVRAGKAKGWRLEIPTEV